MHTLRKIFIVCPIFCTTVIERDLRVLRATIDVTAPPLNVIILAEYYPYTNIFHLFITKLTTRCFSCVPNIAYYATERNKQFPSPTMRINIGIPFKMKTKL